MQQAGIRLGNRHGTDNRTGQAKGKARKQGVPAKLTTKYCDINASRELEGLIT